MPPCSTVKLCTMLSISAVLMPIWMCFATSSRTAVLSAALFLIISICTGVLSRSRVGTISPLSACKSIFSSMGIWHFLYFLPLPHQQRSFLSMDNISSIFFYISNVVFVYFMLLILTKRDRPSGQNLWMNRPLLSLGSNHVDLGGMSSP